MQLTKVRSEIMQAEFCLTCIFSPDAYQVIVDGDWASMIAEFRFVESIRMQVASEVHPRFLAHWHR